MSSYTYIDLFAGCGGLSLGLHNAGWRGLFAIEKSPDAFKTLKHNLVNNKKHFDWPQWLPQQESDINQVIDKHEGELKALRGHVDLVAGGPPCQGFSTAGLRKEDDWRNNLINSYIKFIRLVQPKLIFFENVKGFTQRFEQNKTKGKAYSVYVKKALELSSRKGANFQYIGYDVTGHIVDFSEYGIPQKRSRFILVGIRKDVSHELGKSAQVFFNQLSANKDRFLVAKGLNPSVPTTLNDAISDLLKEHGTVASPDSKGFEAGKYGVSSCKYQNLMRSEDHKQGEVADSHRFPNHKPGTLAKFSYILANASNKNKNLDKIIRKRYNLKKQTVIPLDAAAPSPTLTTLPDDYIHFVEPRILTVREYARIQSFPDWYEIKGKYTTGGPLRTQEVPRYSQIGNAIPPLFGEQCGLCLKSTLNG